VGLPAETAKLPVADAGIADFSSRSAEVSPSTVRLETDAWKQVKRHLADSRLGSITLATLADYTKKRKAEGIGNRTINIEVGVLRRVLKKYKLWARPAEDYRKLPEPTDIGRALSPEQKLKLFETANSRKEWELVCGVSHVTANTTPGGIELRNVRIGDIEIRNRTLTVRVGKTRNRSRIFPLNVTAMWAIERLPDRAKELGATKAEHYLIPNRVSGKAHDPTKPPTRWGWRTAWRTLTAECGLKGLRPHDLRHTAITKLAESTDASEQTIMSIAGHVSVEMLRH
jgi:integrase